MPDYAFCPGSDKGLGRGEGFAWTWDISARLPEEFEPGAIFPLRLLDANLVRRHPVPPDASMYVLHQSDDNPTIGVSARSRLGLPPLCCKVDGYPF